MGLRSFRKLLDADAALFISANGIIDSNITYLSGFNSEFCAMIAPKARSPILFVTEMEMERAKQAFDGRIVRVGKDYLKVLLKRISRFDIVGVNEQCFSVFHLKSLKGAFKDISHICEEARAVKDSWEIELVKRACRITDEIIQLCINNFRNFKTEDDALGFLENESRNRNVRPAFEPIIASGINAAVPHHQPGGKLRKGFCIIDFGVRCKNYCSDITRTIFLGKPSERERSYYDLLLKAQEKTIMNARPGIKYSELDRQCRQLLGSEAIHMIHGLGHLIGIDVHEGYDKEKLVLKEGMVMTVEPGIYLKGRFGIRIEDTVLVKSEGSEALTRTSKELVCLRK